MTLQEAWSQIYKPYNRFDKDLMALRIILDIHEKRIIELKEKIEKFESLNSPVRKRGRPRKETVHAESDGTSPETASS